MQRIPVLSPENIPLMPTKASKARRLLKTNRAEVVQNDLGLFCIRLKFKPSGYNTQPIAIGVDPGSLYTGIAILSCFYTYLGLNLDLPRQKVSKRLQERSVLRRTRRGRRIDRSKPFKLRNHRQKRFNNRGRKASIPPSIKASKQLEIRAIKELCKLYPVSSIIIEKLNTSKSKGFTRTCQGQNWLLKELEALFKDKEIKTVKGYETHNRREYLGLEKCKDAKHLKNLEAHVNDAIAIASFEFLNYKVNKGKQGYYKGSLIINKPNNLLVVSRLKSRPRKLHDVQYNKKGVRRTYGGFKGTHNYKNGDVVKYIGNKKTITGIISANDLYDYALKKRIKQGIKNTNSVLIKKNCNLNCVAIVA